MRVAKKTIYQAIYVHARGALRREMVSSLRRGGVERQPRKSPTHRTSRFVSAMTSLAERDPDVELRLVPGHWEGDLIVGSQHRSAIATMVERSSRFTLLTHLVGDHNATTVREALVSTVQQLPRHLRQTLTWDQGSEMAEHDSFLLATDMKDYFCDPASPGHPGSNENTMDCSASNPRRKPTCPAGPPMTSKPSLSRSTTGRARPSTGRLWL